MKLLKGLLIVLTGSLVALHLCAADVAGTWTAEMPARHGNTRHVEIALHPDGEGLTGTVTGRHGEADISDGIIDGDYISFKIIREIDGKQVIQNYKGYLDGDTIHFSVTVQRGNVSSALPQQFEAYR